LDFGPSILSERSIGNRRSATHRGTGERATFSRFAISARLRRAQERLSKIISPRKEAMVPNANLHFGG
jgi:hypothetical protein